MAFPATIQALSFSKHGGVEVMEKITVPFPEQDPGSVLIKVSLSSSIYANDNFINGMIGT